MLGFFTALVKTKSFLLYAGASVGLHGDIIRLNGNVPAEYQQLDKHGDPLALRRRGPVVEPSIRALWYPVRIHSVQLGVYGGLGYDLDFNSQWKLGYYSNNHGKYGRFRGLAKPDDQKRVNEYGFSYSAGLSVRFNLR